MTVEEKDQKDEESQASKSWNKVPSKKNQIRPSIKKKCADLPLGKRRTYNWRYDIRTNVPETMDL